MRPSMNEFLKTLLNIRSLRASLRELSFEQLEEAKESANKYPKNKKWKF